MALRNFGTPSARRSLTPRVISAIAVVGLLGALAFTVKDLVRFERANAIKPPASPEDIAPARIRAEAEWRIVRPRLEARLDQNTPLELGAVWSTRAGQICGLVNGRGSFGGLASMVRFYTVDRQPVFHRDADHVAFQRAWFECRRDPYVTLNSGPAEPGFCSSAQGRRHCYDVVNGVRRE
ncbi:hypothetical protein [Caulobacter sp. RHG1]|uniref:hypothetical protein n=1 Tax=Caulobacter sp. (strain RHG1) TaxID=2545762 RepID=UPI001553821A|nr:hypothetical protein [Caulobacter sp. RHG1]NQE60981.1 hypothetical protein [Caulobacter sp. RHG1]